MALNKFTKNGFTYFQLFISCPVCLDEGKNTAHSFWKHSNDGGAIYVGENAFYECKSCGHSAHAMKWFYGCPSHSESPDKLLYKQATIPGVAQAVSCAGQMVNETGTAWLIKFLENLEP